MTAPNRQNTSHSELANALWLKYERLVDKSKFWESARIQLQSYEDVAKEVVQNIPKKTGIDLDFGFVDSLALNGVAFKHEAHGVEFRFATVCAGAILYFHEFFSYLMSRTDVLPLIGLAKGEKNLPLIFQPPRQFPPLLQFAQSGAVTSVNPVDEMRTEFANIMAVKASEFLIRHEIGHCVNGHIAHSRFALNEGDRVTSEVQELALLRHTFEMDADAFAANAIFHHAFHDLQVCGDFSWGEELASFPPNKILYPALVAIGLAFRLLARPEIAPLSAGAHLQGTHPHPLIRAHFFLVTGAEIAAAQGLIGDNKWLPRLAVKSAMDAEIIWSTITGQSPQLRSIVFDDTSAESGLKGVHEYLHNLLDCWHHVRPRLQQFSLVPLALSKYEIANLEKRKG